jgi:hypothetical protein
MSTVLTTTDDVHKTVIDVLKARLPNVPVKELPRPADLLGCFADRYLGEWMPVAAEGDESSSVRDGLIGPAMWSLERRTQFNGHVHVRGTLRFVVDRSMDGQVRRALQQATEFADQIAAVGQVHEILLVREPDTDVPFGSAVHMMLLAHVESSGADQIRTDDRGVPWLTDTQIKVREIVLDFLCYGWSALRIFHALGATIPLSKIHAAFTYFDNHRSEVLKEIEEADRYAAEMREKLGQPPVVERLLALRK